MTQQQPKEVSRGQARRSQHFKFVEKPRGAEQKTMLPEAKKANPMTGFARWSEYVSQDSGEIEVPDSDYKSISISLSKEESSSMTDPGNSKQALQTSDKLQDKVEEVTAANRKEQVKEKKEEPQAAGNSYAKSYSKILKEVRNSNSSPFTIPNISEIKPREVVNTRNSELFLLDLLNQGQEREQEVQAHKVVKEQESDPLPSKQQQQAKSRKSISYKELQKRKSERLPYKQDSDPLPKHEVQPASRPKRVTINDRGKIKYPNDSISGDISYILPQEFREVEEKGPNHYKRKLVIEEEVEDDDKPAEEPRPVEEPMDIVNDKEEKEVKAVVVKDKSKGRDKAEKAEKAEKQEKAKNAQNKAKMKKAEQKLKDIAKKAPVPRVNDNRKSKIVRVSERQPSRDDNSRRSASSKSINASTQPKKKVVEKRLDINKPSKKGTVAQQQQKRRKFKKEDTTYVQIVEIMDESPAKNNERPRRMRQKPKNYWENKKMLIGKNGSYQSLSKERVLEILGFHTIEDIKANLPACSVIDIRITVVLGPRKKYYSSGLDFAAMREVGVDFNSLCIQLYKPKETSHLVAIKNDIQPLNILDDVTIQPGQTFSFENTSTAKTYSIALQLYKRKEQVEEQEE